MEEWAEQILLPLCALSFACFYQTPLKMEVEPGVQKQGKKEGIESQVMIDFEGGSFEK